MNLNILLNNISEPTNTKGYISVCGYPKYGVEIKNSVGGRGARAAIPTHPHFFHILGCEVPYANMKFITSWIIQTRIDGKQMYF